MGRFINRESMAMAKGEQSPESAKKKRRTGGILIESAEGVRFAHAETTLSTERQEPNFPKWRKVLGRILPFVDPVVDKKTHQVPFKSERNPEANFNQWVTEVTKTRKSGRKTTRTVIPENLGGAIVVGSPEWNLEPYPGMPDFETNEERLAWWENEIREGRVEMPEPPTDPPEAA